MSVTLTVQPDFPEFDIHQALSRITTEADWVGLRFVQEQSHQRAVRNQHPETNSLTFTRGMMVEAVIEGQLAYAATSNLSESGLRQAVRSAAYLARTSAAFKILDFSETLRPRAQGQYVSPYQEHLDTASLGEFTDQLVKLSGQLKVSGKIVDTRAEAVLTETWSQYVTSSGTNIDQRYLLVSDHFAATAQDGSETQRRSLNGPVARCSQAGLEFFNFEALFADCERVGREALELLTADNCPNETLDLLLAPDQMILQIHESVGHPLELDRILGDERNYAGWSFVTAEDFGRLQYGSNIMNVTFDSAMPGEFASYAFDDCGHRATREYLIKEGRLLRGLGSLESQARLNLPGVANFRSNSWNRAPIDRMANINLEPGASTRSEMIASIERGVYMEANTSWSIDDYRNKFQFGCEYARLIENGTLTKTLKNPNYRGATTPFWHSLQAIGRGEELEVFGSRFCGKGEPNQTIHVGHASPPCLFTAVEVFGGSR